MLQHQYSPVDMCRSVFWEHLLDGHHEARGLQHACMLPPGKFPHNVETASLHLKSAKGFGLLDADVAKATKVILLALQSMDMLAKMCTVFAMLLALKARKHP